MGSLDARRIQLIVLAMIGAGALLVAMLLASGNMGEGDGIRLRPGVQAPLPAAAIGEGVGTDGATGGVFADSVYEFTQTHGEPPDATFGRIRIPAISVDAPLTYRLVDGDIMPEPSGPVDVAYYDMSEFPGLGGWPGAGGNAIFAGHVDLNRDIPYAGGAHYRGPAIFWSLDALRYGDLVELDVDGETLRYQVVSSEDLAADASTDWGLVWSADVETDTITLFTCGGEFDPDTFEYSRRLVVRAERI